VREHAARNLGCNYHSTLGCDSAVAREPLERLLRDRDEFVRLEAARSLGDLRDARARRALEELVRREREERVQREAVLALGRLGDRGAEPLLERLEASPDERIRAAAAEALQRIATARRVRPELGGGQERSDDGEQGQAQASEQGNPEPDAPGDRTAPAE
jgi:hypothetical protein